MLSSVGAHTRDSLLDWFLKVLTAVPCASISFILYNSLPSRGFCTFAFKSRSRWFGTKPSHGVGRQNKSKAEVNGSCEAEISTLEKLERFMSLDSRELSSTAANEPNFSMREAPFSPCRNRLWKRFSSVATDIFFRLWVRYQHKV